MNIVLEDHSSEFVTDFLTKEDLTTSSSSSAPGTPQTTTLTPQTSGQSLSFGSMTSLSSTMPKMPSLDDENSNSNNSRPVMLNSSMKTKSPDSVIPIEERTKKNNDKPAETTKTVKFQEDPVEEEPLPEPPLDFMSSIRVDSAEEMNIPIGTLKRNFIRGRVEEIRTLKTSLQRMVTAKRSFDKAMKFDSGFLKIPSKEFVLIKGAAGVGKTTMARKLSSYVSRSKGGLFCSTKFDKGHQVPFGKIAHLFRQVCREVLSMSEESAFLVGDILQTELGDQKYTLLHWVPELRHTFDEDEVILETNLSRIQRYEFDVEHAQQRWRYAFRVLSRALSAVVSPLVLLLDDIQWSDLPSMELMDYMISDKQNPNPFMVIGCYRCKSNSNERDSLPPGLAARLQHIREHQDKFRYNVTEVDLELNTLEEVQQMLAAMMSVDKEDAVHNLAKVCFQKTRGNAYFVMEWMTMLQQQGLLRFNKDSSIWTWDDTEIELKIEMTTTTKNVVDLLQARIQRLSFPAQTLLHCAAYLGSSFHKPTVTLMWEKYYEQKDVSVDELMESALCDQHIIKETSELDTCQWVHDTVQEAAKTLLGGSDKFFRAEIGKILMKSMDEEQLQDQLFVVVDLINQSEETGNVEFAKLNLQAAKKAREIAAFQSARDYATKGFQIIPQGDQWTKHRDLAIELCTMIALMELATGNGTAFDKYSEMVLDRRDCSDTEAMPLLVARMYKVGTVEMKYQQAVDDSLVLLKDWGIKIPQPPRFSVQSKALRALSQTIKITKREPNVSEDLGIITDPDLLYIMKLLSHLSRACLKSKQIYLNIQVICKTVELTLKHGLSEAAGPAFATLGMLTIALNQDMQTGSRFGQSALEIQERMPESSQAETLYIVHAYCLPWAHQLKAEPFLQAHNFGMSAGRHDYALWALVCNQIMAPWTLGKSLVSMREYCEDLLSQSEEVGQTIQSVVVKIFWQALVKLSPSHHDTTSKSSSSSQLEGEIFSASNFKGTDPVVLAFVHLLQGELLLFFDIEKAAERAIECGDQFSKDAPALFIGVVETFHRAVALYAMARKTRKRKYKKRAKALRRRIEKWLDEGNPNVKHYEIFLNAEQAALDNRVDLADTRYRRAIVYAARTGHLHHTALFNERYAEFLQDVKQDENEASHRIHEAIRFYREWGAFAKATELQTDCYE